nr:DNA repair protein UVH3 isoform X2 [Tanacetum cinerariifolium]
MGKSDLFVLRKLCYEKFGWGSQKADELLQHVLKEYNKHENEASRVICSGKKLEALFEVFSHAPRRNLCRETQALHGLRIELLP